MLDGFGIRPSAPGATSRRAAAPAPAWASALSALSVLLGCSGEAMVVAEERQVLGGGGDSADAGESGSGGASGIAIVEDCPLSPAERSELLGCWPTRHVGTWRGYFIGVARYETRDGGGAEFPAGELALRLDGDGTGDLTFTDGESVDGLDPCSGLPLSRCSELGRVRMGFAYELEDIQLVDPDREDPSPAPGEPLLRTGARMSFQIRLGQPWDGSCSDPTPQDPAAAACESGACAKSAPGTAPGTAPGSGGDEEACSCSTLGCLARAPSLSISLRMSDDGNALRGTYVPDAGVIPDARLEFLRESP